MRILVFLEGILERDGAVEYEMAGGTVLVVRCKVAETEELEAVGYEIVEQTADLHHSDYAARLVMTEYEKKFHSRGKNINYVKALVP